MAIVNSCCCLLSLRVGSFICGFYTLIYYSIMVVAGFFSVDQWDHPLSNGTLSMYSLGPYADDSYPLFIAAVTSFGITALTSIILLIGVFLENRLLLLPWIASLITSTLVGFIYTVFVLGVAEIHPWFPFMATFDLAICLLNIYCVLCVVSLYQEYKSRRTRNGHENLQYEKENSSCDVNSYKRSMTLTESDRPSSRDPNSSQRRCSSPHPGLLTNSRRLSAVNLKTMTGTTPKTIPINDNESHNDATEQQSMLNGKDETKNNVDECDVKCPSTTSSNLDVKNLGNGRRRSSSTTKHVQFHPTIEEAPDIALTDAHIQLQVNGNGKS